MPRVRELLDALSNKQFKQLVSLLPLENQSYPAGFLDSATGCGLMPNAIKTNLDRLYPSRGSSLIGLAGELLLRCPEVPTITDLINALKLFDAELDTKAIEAINRSKTTKRFFESIYTTRERFAKHTKGAKYDQVVFQERGPITIEGHPDIMTSKIIFEVKISTKVKEDWPYFMCQMFAYAALSPTHTHVCLVLPLHETGLGIKVTAWDKREEFITILSGGSLASDKPVKYKKDEAAPITAEQALMLRLREREFFMRYGIGSHISKQPTLLASVMGLDPSFPWQIMVSNPQSGKMKVSDADLAATSELLESRRVNLFVHARYTINLGRPYNDPKCKIKDYGDLPIVDDEGFHLASLRKELRVAKAMGAKGLVVHLGNHVEHKRSDSIRYMWENIQRCLSDASSDCMLLLETGCGEGTEICWQQEEFIAFVDSIKDPRFGVCLDTCHVHAAGYDADKFLNAIRPRVRLVHFNDSKAPKGSHRDLHEIVGGGTISMDTLTNVAELCTEVGIPMVRE